MGLRLAYFGDLRLPTKLKGIVPSWSRGSVQTYQGLDRTNGLVTANSPNWVTGLDVVCELSPESTFTKKAHRSRELTTANALKDRGEAVHPVVWIEDGASPKTVG